jgi:hypothetical protein
MTEAQKNVESAVLVTTLHRGVFFGYHSNPDALLAAGQGTLSRARNCVYWPVENRGFLGLAADGPKKGARIGPAVEFLRLRDIVSVSDCSPAAVKAWESELWSK